MADHYHLTISVSKDDYDYIRNLLTVTRMPTVSIECDDELFAKIIHHTALTLLRAIQVNIDEQGRAH